MKPQARRRLAAAGVAVSVLIGWPLSWWLPTLDEIWFQRLVTWLSFLALTLTLADVWTTSDVRTNQDDDPPRSAAPGGERGHRMNTRKER